MNWKTIGDEQDFQRVQGTERFSYIRETKRAFVNHTHPNDEQQALKPEFGSNQSGLRLHLVQPGEAADKRPVLMPQHF